MKKIRSHLYRLEGINRHFAVFPIGLPFFSRFASFFLAGFLVPYKSTASLFSHLIMYFSFSFISHDTYTTSHRGECVFFLFPGMTRYASLSIQPSALLILLPSVGLVVSRVVHSRKKKTRSRSEYQSARYHNLLSYTSSHFMSIRYGKKNNTNSRSVTDRSSIDLGEDKKDNIILTKSIFLPCVLVDGQWAAGGQQLGPRSECGRTFLAELIEADEPQGHPIRTQLTTIGTTFSSFYFAQVSFLFLVCVVRRYFALEVLGNLGPSQHYHCRFSRTELGQRFFFFFDCNRTAINPDKLFKKKSVKRSDKTPRSPFLLF